MKKPLKHFLTIRNIGMALLTIAFAFTTAFTAFNIYQLFSDSYIIKDTDVVKIGTFKMQDKAYFSGGGKSYSPRYTFESRDGYRFRLESSAYKAIIDKQELRDTLQYHELTFTVYSDKETLEAYRNSAKPIHINVLQFQIGNKTYIDLDKVNNAEEYKVISSIIAGLLFLSFLFYNYYKKLVQQKEQHHRNTEVLSS